MPPSSPTPIAAVVEEGGVEAEAHEALAAPGAESAEEDAVAAETAAEVEGERSR
jgi:hypothetical protein